MKITDRLFMAAFSANALHSNQKLSTNYYRNLFCQFKTV